MCIKIPHVANIKFCPCRILSLIRYFEKCFVFCLCVQDDTALLFLGQCYESGFGVGQNLGTAIDYYKQAARAGNKQAKSLLTPPQGTNGKDKHTFETSLHVMSFERVDTTVMRPSPPQQEMQCCAPSVQLPVSLEQSVTSLLWSAVPVPLLLSLLTSLSCLTPGVPGA